MDLVAVCVVFGRDAEIQIREHARQHFACFVACNAGLMLCLTQIGIALKRHAFKGLDGHVHLATQLGPFGIQCQGLTRRGIDQGGQLDLCRGQVLVDQFQCAQAFQQLFLISQ